MQDEVQYARASEVPGLVLSTARFSAFRFEAHYHLDCHVALVADGVQRQWFQGESVALTRGSVQLMPAGEVHDGFAATEESYTLHTFRLSPTMLRAYGEEVTGRSHFPLRAAAVLRDARLAEHLIGMHAALRRGSVDPLSEEARVMELLESLFARLLKPAPQVVTGRLTPPQLVLLRDFMEARLGDKVLLEDLAAVLRVDRFRFLKLFKRTVGMTPHAWLHRLRLERAFELLKASRKRSITEVAHALGFFDQSHFTRAFRSAYGATPGQFQRSGGNFLQVSPVVGG